MKHGLRSRRPVAPDPEGSDSLRARLDRAREMIAQRTAAEAAGAGIPAASKPGALLAGWDTDPAVLSIGRREIELRQLGLANPFFQPHDSVSAGTIRIGGRELLNFSGYNY